MTRTQRVKWAPAAAVVVAGAMLGWLLMGGDAPVEGTATEAGIVLEAPPVAPSVSARLTDSPLALAEVSGGGESEDEVVHVVDSPEELTRARRAYANRLLDNIEHLESKARQARTAGHPARAKLMERRIEELERRLEEFDARQDLAEVE